MSTSPTIATARLLLRLAEPADVPALLRFHADNADHLAPFSPEPPPDALTESYWQRQVERNREDAAHDRAVRLFLFPKDDPGRVVGRLSLTNVARGAACYADLGYALAEDRQGQGLMTEAVEAAIRYAFDDLGLHRVKAAYVPTNERSGRLLRRLGFVVEGYARDYLRIGGRWQDHILVGLINPDWRPSP